MLKRKTNIFVTILFVFVAVMLIGIIDTANVNAAEPVIVSTEAELKAAVDGKTDTGEADTETTYVKLVNGIALNGPLNIYTITDLTIDLNGYNISPTVESASVAIYYGGNGKDNDFTEGSLTIKDSSDTASGNFNSYKYFYISNLNTSADSTKNFKLTIEGGNFYARNSTVMFQLSDNSDYMKDKNITFDFQVKGGTFKTIVGGSDAVFLKAYRIRSNDVTLNVKLDKLTIKANNTRLVEAEYKDFTVGDVLGSESKFTVKNSETSKSETLNIIIDKEVSVTKKDAIKSKVGFEFDTIEITKPWEWNVSDVTYTEYCGYTEAKSVSIPICNTGEDENSISGVTVDSDNFIIEEGNKTGIKSGDTDTSWKIKAKPGLAQGTYTATITLQSYIGQYKSTVTLKVSRQALTQANITGVSQEITYGDTYIPKFSSSPQLDESDYTFNYQKKDGEDYIDIDYKPTDVGEYKVYIKVTNPNYLLRVRPTYAFAIVAKKIEPTVSNIADQTYTGGQIIPEVSVTYNGTTLTKGVDYKVGCGMNQEAGTGTVTIKPVDGSNYTFTDIKKTFNIAPKALTAGNVTLNPTSFKYTGNELTPTPVVKDGSKILTKDTDYELSYSNNINVGENTATVTVTGKGNYTGIVTKNFSIKLYPTPATPELEYPDDTVFHADSENGSTIKVELDEDYRNTISDYVEYMYYQVNGGEVKEDSIWSWVEFELKGESSAEITVWVENSGKATYTYKGVDALSEGAYTPVLSPSSTDFFTDKITVKITNKLPNLSYIYTTDQDDIDKTDVSQWTSKKSFPYAGLELTDSATVCVACYEFGTYSSGKFSADIAKEVYTKVEQSSAASVSGTVTSYGDAEANVTIHLTEQGGTEPAYEEIVKGNAATYSFGNVAAGTYVMKVMKSNHVAREYTITVGSSDVTQDATICLLGDVNGDGKVNTKDRALLTKHINETSLLSGYKFDCGDVDSNSKINTKDRAKITKHINESVLLW